MTDDPLVSVFVCPGAHFAWKNTVKALNSFYSIEALVSEGWYLFEIFYIAGIFSFSVISNFS